MAEVDKFVETKPSAEEFAEWAKKNGWIKVEELPQADGCGISWTLYGWLSPTGVFVRVESYDDGSVGYDVRMPR